MEKIWIVEMEAGDYDSNYTKILKVFDSEQKATDYKSRCEFISDKIKEHVDDMECFLSYDSWNSCFCSNDRNNIKGIYVIEFVVT